MRLKMLAIPLVAAVALLAGCTPGSPVTLGATQAPSANGVDALSADQIMDKALGTVTGATSFRVAGTFGSGVFAATADLTYSDGNMKGQGTFLGVGVQLVKFSTNLYANADPSFFAQYVPANQQDVLKSIGNTWVVVPAAWVTFLVPVPLTTDAVAGEFKPAAPLTKGDTAEIAGTPVINVTDANGTVYSVATTGDPNLVKVAYSNGNVLNLSNFNEDVTIEAPPNAKNLLDLLGLSS
jgi:hypothetical protein